MNNVIKTIATETTLTAAERLSVDTGYSSQCGKCETEFYLTKAEWDNVWHPAADNDVPCPVCEGGQSLPMTEEETAAREFLATIHETLSGLKAEANLRRIDTMRPSVRRALEIVADALYTADDATYPYRKQ